MKLNHFVVAVFLGVGLLVALQSCAAESVEEQFQNDADLARLEHLEYWTGLIEEYEGKTGQFPFADRVSREEPVVLVRIATREQSRFFDLESEAYNKELDNNFGGRFEEPTVAAFVTELERGLGRQIVEKYDIQRAPTRSPVWYNYFVTESGYLVWVTCMTCGVTQISTLLLDGFTPTVNIASEGMKDSVTKALTRDEMLAHPTFLEWRARKFVKEGFVREREEAYRHDSKRSRNR